MGWIGYKATHYYKNGQVNRKAELDASYEESGWKVLKSTMDGTTYYAALQNAQRRVKNEDGTYKKDAEGRYVREEVPEKERTTFGVVVLTSMRDGMFCYKDMDETMGPCYSNCPTSILKLLTPTKNENANKWRAACYAKQEKKKGKTPLSKLPVKAKIEWTLPYDLDSGWKKGDKMILTKYKTWRGITRWVNGRYYYSMKTIGDNYVVLDDNAA